jgi:hypothetical protein
VKQLPPPQREPFFAPGGLWVLGYVVTTFVAVYAFAIGLDYVFRWLGL